MRRKIFLLTVLFSGLCVYANMPNTPRGRLNNFVVEQIRLLPKQTPASPAQWTKYQTVDFEKRNDVAEIVIFKERIIVIVPITDG